MYNTSSSNMTDSINIGLIQREITPHDPPENLLSALEMLYKCAEQDVDLIVMTELWTTGLLDPDDRSASRLAERIDGPTVTSLREFCGETGTYLLAGSIALLEKDGIKNTSVLIDPDGEIILKYSKIHLFGSMHENLVFQPGDTVYAAQVKGVGIGVEICYDLRFPALTRAFAKAGCEVVLVPALWPEVRINQWEILLRARAIENQVYMVGANGIANQGELFFPGHSMIVGPTGDSLNTPEMRPSAIVRTLDLKKLRYIRSEVCYLDDEREINEVKWSNRMNEQGSKPV
jgi:omega-amidase